MHINLKSYIVDLLFSVTCINLFTSLLVTESVVNMFSTKKTKVIILYLNVSHSCLLEVVTAAAPASIALFTSSSVRISPPARTGIPVSSATS